MNDLTRRTLTAVVFAAVVLAAVLWNRWSFYLLILVIQTGCLMEYLKLAGTFQEYQRGKKRLADLFTVLLSLTIHGLILFTGEQQIFLIVYLLLVIPFALVLLAAELFYGSAKPLLNGALNAAGILYVTVPFACFYLLTTEPFLGTKHEWYPYLSSVPLGLILLVWTNDTFAYLGGTLAGKHKILPWVSPNKSWEGFFTGLVCSLATAFLLSILFRRHSITDWMAVSLIISVTGTMGDFFQSSIKRNAGVKDSGHLLPGHGGLLDRFDALIFSLPFVTAYLLFRQ